jgi:putative flippase GtrA
MTVELHTMLSKTKLAALFRFGLAGLLSAAVALGSTALLHEAGWLEERVAAAVGLVAALSVNFLVARFYVFRGTHVGVWRQLTAFLASSGAFRGLEYSGFFIVNTALHVHYLIALMLVLGCSFILKFFVYEGWVFARSRGT